jgi:hypothetical protein
MTSPDGSLDQIEAEVRRIRRGVWALVSLVAGAAMFFLVFGDARGAAFGVLASLGLTAVEELRRTLKHP